MSQCLGPKAVPDKWAHICTSLLALANHWPLAKLWHTVHDTYIDCICMYHAGPIADSVVHISHSNPLLALHDTTLLAV